MRGDDAFAVLGLRPGAGRDEVDQAYRRLIKRYHPDSADGDVARAAEINRAYAEIRQGAQPHRQNAPPPPPAAAFIHPRAIPHRPSRPRGTLVGAIAIIAAVGIAAGATMKMDPRRSWPELPLAGMAEDRAPRALAGKADLDEPLETRMIELSLADAMEFSSGGDGKGAAEFSRSCLRRMAASPSVPLFDSCAAFDEAIAILMADNPALGSAAFDPSAVTSRQVSAARMLSADYLDAESRLQRIRTQVQSALLESLGKAAEPRRAVIRPAIARSPTRYAPRQRIYRPPPVAHYAPPPTQPAAAPAPRVEPPRPVPVAAVRTPPPPTAEPRGKPAWQQPLRPAWQHPLPPRS